MLRTSKDPMIERHWNKSLWKHLKAAVMVQEIIWYCLWLFDLWPNIPTQWAKNVTSTLNWRLGATLILRCHNVVNESFFNVRNTRWINVISATLILRCHYVVNQSFFNVRNTRWIDVISATLILRCHYVVNESFFNVRKTRWIDVISATLILRWVIVVSTFVQHKIQLDNWRFSVD